MAKSNDNIILIAAMALAAYIVMNTKKTGATSSGASSVTALKNALATSVSEIFNSDGSRYTNGWRYFSDGTSISPSGDYYMNGNLVWTAS